MKDGCVFCEYEGPSRVVAVWNMPLIRRRMLRPDVLKVIVFAPVDPVVPGHLLVVPEVHVENAVEDPEITGLVMEVAARVAANVGGSCNIITSVGREATQSVMHLHVHVVPRVAGDRLRLPWG